MAGLALTALFSSLTPCLAAPGNSLDPSNISLTPSPGKTSQASLASDFNALLPKAEAGDAEAQEKVGAAYCNGEGVAQDYQQGRGWLEKAAAQNNARAASWLGLLYANGHGVPRDETKAFQYYLAAANEGNDVSDLLQVAERYARGNGVTASDVESLSWYAKAAGQGSSQGQLQAGLAYFNGIGATKDPEKAFGYFLRAAHRDVAQAQYYLAYYYWHGLFVERDPVQAYKWIQLATRHDRDDEAVQLSREIDSSLTPAQVAQGEALLENWSRELRGHDSAAPLPATFTSGTSATMPFESHLGEIILAATINGHDKIKFMLDTGSPTTLIDAIFVSQFKLPRGSTYDSFTGIGKQTVLGSSTDDLSLALPGLTFDHISLGISSGLGRIDGILGYDILRNYVIKIDYVAKKVTFLSPQSFNPAEAGQLLPTTTLHSKILVRAKLGNNHFESGPEDFVLDTGCSDGFVLSQHYVLSYPLLAFGKGWEGEAEGIGGTLWAQRVHCFGAQLGDFPLQDPVVTVVKRDQGAFTHMNGLIGNEIWKFFDLTIDYPNMKVYLKPNSTYRAPAAAESPAATAAKSSGPD